jgi:uncharacterized membrane protein HdeD (DUF308 family)
MKFDSFEFKWGLPIFFGALLAMLGLVAILIPVATSWSISWGFGFVLTASGAAQIAHTFHSSSRGWVSRLLLAAVSIIAGIVVMRDPLAGAVGITLALGFYFLVNSAGKAILALEFKDASGNGWLVVSSIFSLLVGTYVMVTLPDSSLIVPGTLFGIDLMIYGFSTIAISNGFRKQEVLREQEWKKQKNWPKKAA